MIEFEALYYDGKSSASRRVRVCGSEHDLHVVGAGVDERVPLAKVDVAPAVGNVRRVLQLPGGAQLQTGDDAAVAALFPRANALEDSIHRLERRWPYALGAVLVVAVVAWWCVVYGVPTAARAVSAAVRPEVAAALDVRTLRALDGMGCGPSTLDAARQDELRRRLAALTAGLGDGHAYHLELRACPGIGANAFALPGGTIVMTDGLVQLARNDEQIVAVLAHEVGHVRHRHGLRLALQSLGIGALVAALAGDAVSITGLAVAVPTALLQSGYSRAFEEEADAYAFERLKAIGSSPRHFADMITLMEGERSRGALDYLSSHPSTAKRIERARATEK